MMDLSSNTLELVMVKNHHSHFKGDNDNDIAQDDVLGSIFFQAPDEGGTVQMQYVVASTIEAVSEGDFSASSNAQHHYVLQIRF